MSEMLYNICLLYIYIYIKSINKIIEVKSIWIYNLHKEKNILKSQACINKGYDFEFWIFDEKKNREIINVL